MKIENCLPAGDVPKGHKLKIIWEWIVDILFPRRCFGCGREGTYICKACEVFLSEVDPMLGRSWTCDVHVDIACPTSNIVSVWEYEGIIEKAIWKIKFDGCYDIIGELVEKAFEKIDLELPKDTVITFVPMWKKKEKQRGFNQAELIAKKMSQLLSLAEQPLLEKARDNRSQIGLGPRERMENVKGVFGLLTSNFNKFNNVLVVDDVYTTGATMQECIKTLKQAGFKNVWGFTIARKLSI